MHAVWGMEDGRVDIVRPFGMEIAHLMRVVQQLVERMSRVDLLVRQINDAAQRREVDIDPVRIIGLHAAHNSVLGNAPIYRILKSVWKIGTVETLILMLWRIDTCIATRLWDIGLGPAGSDSQH